MTRYQRQIVLDEIGPARQDRLRRAAVLCIGAGGLGAPALLYLAAAGIGRIGIAEFDRIEESNLQRQILYATRETGEPKAERAAARLEALNPEIRIDIYSEGLHADNAETLFRDYDLILDGTDNFATKFLINDAAVKFGKPWVYGSISRFEGQVAVFDAERGPCYRCLFPDIPAQRILNCAEAGVIGAVAGITGTAQAMQAIQIIAAHPSFSPLYGQLWSMDARTMQTKTITLAKDPACPVCSQKKEDIMLTYTQPVCAALPECGAEKIGAADTLLVDVREAEEWQAGHINGARHVPLSALMDGYVPPDLPRTGTIVLYCKKGKRSQQAGQILKARGFDNLLSLAGGYDGWCEDAGLQSGR